MERKIRMEKEFSGVAKELNKNIPLLKNTEPAALATTRKRIFSSGEAGLEAEEFDTKVLVESNLKLPKVMHDMFIRLSGTIDNKQEVVEKLQVVGLVFSRFKMRMLIMDCPNGYICRLRSTTAAVFSGKEESLGNDFSKAYQLIWKAKEVCKKTESIVKKYMSTVEVDFESDSDSGDSDDDDTVHLPDSLCSP
ncbi:hypothetical protein PS6_002740 [Mucor atramentarius]